MSKITTCLWYDGTAEEAANFYVTLLPDSRIDNLVYAPSDNPSNKEGELLGVEFTLAGQKFFGLNGGPDFASFTGAISFQIETLDQEETDRLWYALTSNGGEESMCGWLKDRWGVSWQVTPKQLVQHTFSKDPAVAKRAFEAMMTMKKIDIATIEKAAAGETAHA